MSVASNCCLEFRCAMGTGVCCSGCDRFERCADACLNQQDACGMGYCKPPTKNGAFSALRLVEIREKAGISRQELAKQLKTDTINVMEWERGIRTPYKKTQEKICFAIGCQMADLQEQCAEA